MSLSAACERYCEEVADHQPSADDTAKALEHCCRLMGAGRRLVSITADDISMAVRKRAGETYGKRNRKLVSGATVNRQIVEPMKRLMRRAKRVWEMSCDPDRIPWKELRMKEATERVRELTTEEADRFWAALRPDYIPLVWFLAHRGLRVRAALGIERQHLDLENKRVKVWLKATGWGWAPLAAEHVAVLSAEVAKSAGPAVWTYEMQRKPNVGKRMPITYAGLRRVIRNALGQAGIPDFHIHDLRHDFASKLLRKTGNLKLVQRALGHADISSTVRYAHVLDEDVSAGMEGLSRNSTEVASVKAAKTGAK